jgi:mevalonate kinase
MPIPTITVGEPFTLVIGDTGVRSPTSGPVEAVRRAWRAEPQRYEALFDRVAEIAQTARRILESGQNDRLGSLMDENHALLSEMGVSSTALDRLVAVARQAGASGAKLSGGGWGGNMIALVAPQDAQQVAAGLREHGALRTLITRVE